MAKNINLMVILNYLIRILSVCVGLTLLLGFINPNPNDQVMTRSIGGLVTAFGIYRLVLYYYQQKQEHREDIEE